MGVWGEMWCCVFLILQTGRWNIGKNKRCSQNKTIHACSFYKNLEETQHCPCTLGKFQIIHFFSFNFGSWPNDLSFYTKYYFSLYYIFQISLILRKNTPLPLIYFFVCFSGVCVPTKLPWKKRNMIFDCSLNEKKKIRQQTGYVISVLFVLPPSFPVSFLFHQFSCILDRFLSFSPCLSIHFFPALSFSSLSLSL